MKIRASAAAAVSVFALGIATPVVASHSWNNYHWSRSGAEIAPPVDDNVSAAWDSYLRVAINGTGATPGWNESGRIQSGLFQGSASPKTCKPVAGRIQVCNARYGRVGWLGIASIWLSNGHISQGTTKLNDTYFETAQYNTLAWRRMVMCQEIGHDYGLGHTNEIFDNANDGTCMDYTDAPGGGMLGGVNFGPSNEYPNAHDFTMLDSIYGGHADPTNFGVRTPGGSAPQGAVSEAANGDTPAAWGRAVHLDGKGRPDVFVQDIAPGRRKITHVFWAIGEGPKGLHHD